MKIYNIVLAGVGGQGIILAAETLGTAAVDSGYNVRVSELHGMAQRGGSVTSHIRIGEKAFAPTVLEGTADLIVGFEPMETLRNIKFASQKGNTTILLNKKPFKITGAIYPPLDKIFNQIQKFSKSVKEIDAMTLAKKAGAEVTQNIVMLGAVAAIKGIPMESGTIKKAMQKLVPPKYLDINNKSFELGFSYIQ
jgi:indolepyruvate ferredoxin oxidoreductase beta subunit